MRHPRNNPIQGVLFDWDGTLLNSYEADSAAYLAMFREMGIPWGIQDLARHYSPNWYHVYRAAKLPRKRWDDADHAWRAQYAKHKPQLLAGARRVLTRLQSSHELGLVTSGDRDRVVRQLREFRLTKMFAARVCSGDTARKKPHPEPLRLALQQMELDPRPACMWAIRRRTWRWHAAQVCAQLRYLDLFPRKNNYALPDLKFCSNRSKSCRRH